MGFYLRRVMLARRRWPAVRRSVLVLLLLALACADPRTPVWVPPEASMLRPLTSYPSGNVEVAFTIPITDVEQQEAFTTRLSQQLEQGRWRRRTHQYLNPTVATSFAEGWRRAGGDVRLEGAMPSAGMYKWHGEWEDDKGNVMQYSLLASHFTDGRGRIRVFEMYVPAKLVMQGPNGDYR